MASNLSFLCAKSSLLEGIARLNAQSKKQSHIVRRHLNTLVQAFLACQESPLALLQTFRSSLREIRINL